MLEIDENTRLGIYNFPKIPGVITRTPLGTPSPSMAFGFAPPNVDAACLTCLENVPPPLNLLLATRWHYHRMLNLKIQLNLDFKLFFAMN